MNVLLLHGAVQPRTQGLSLEKTLASAGHVIPRIWDFLNKNI